MDVDYSLMQMAITTFLIQTDIGRYGSFLETSKMMDDKYRDIAPGMTTGIGNRSANWTWHTHRHRFFVFSPRRDKSWIYILEPNFENRPTLYRSARITPHA